MRKFLAIAPAFGVAMLSTAALAATMTVTGVVKSINMKKDQITLADKSVYTLGEGFEAEKFTVGEKVSIVYSMKGGKMIASSVKAAK